MKNLKIGDIVVYTGETNSWTYYKDIVENSQGWIESVVVSKNGISYKVYFDDGVIATIDSSDLVPN